MTEFFTYCWGRYDSMFICYDCVIKVFKQLCNFESMLESISEVVNVAHQIRLQGRSSSESCRIWTSDQSEPEMYQAVRAQLRDLPDFPILCPSGMPETIFWCHL